MPGTIDDAAHPIGTRLLNKCAPPLVRGSKPLLVCLVLRLYREQNALFFPKLAPAAVLA